MQSRSPKKLRDARGCVRLRLSVDRRVELGTARRLREQVAHAEARQIFFSLGPIKRIIRPHQGSNVRGRPGRSAGLPRCRSLIREGAAGAPDRRTFIERIYRDGGKSRAESREDCGRDPTIEIVELCTWHAISSATPNRRRFDPSHHVGIMPKRLVANSRSVARRCR